MSLDFGFERLVHEWDLLSAEATPEAIRATPYVTRILRNLQQGILNAKTGNG
jgi:hypothetical protein